MTVLFTGRRSNYSQVRAKDAPAPDLSNVRFKWIIWFEHIDDFDLKIVVLCVGRGS